LGEDKSGFTIDRSQMGGKFSALRGEQRVLGEDKRDSTVD